MRCADSTAKGTKLKQNSICRADGAHDGNDLLLLQKTLYASKNPTRRWLHNRRREWVEHAIRDHAKNGTGTALEIGPGSGLYLPLLSECFEKVVAIDVEESFLQNALLCSNEYEHVYCVRDDITATALPSAAFDLILCSEVIEHIEDSESALRNMRRLLKKDGILVLTTPHKYCPLELCSRIAYLPGIIDLVRRVYREPILDAGHINLMTGHRLQQLLEKTGFTVKSQEAFGCYIPLVAEFFGSFGLAAEQKIEKMLSKTRLQGLLWTQAYILTPL